MSIAHTSTLSSKNSRRIKRVTKSPRRPGVSPKFIQNILRNANLQSSQGHKP